MRQFGSPELLDELLPGVYRGEVRFAMDYTEPEGGSDIATCKTRAVRDGDEWVINGQKMFTSGAHNCRYIFLLTNTEPTGRRHRNLTMFLVPTDTPGLEIQGLRTVDGERTNITYYGDVRIPDRYRLGEVNDGWAVLHGPLTAEHGAGGADPVGLADIATMGSFAALMAETADEVATQANIGDGRWPIGSAGHTRASRRHSAPPAYSGASRSARPCETSPRADGCPRLCGGSAVERRAAVPVGPACRHLRRDVFRNIIAQYVLGLGRPNYWPPK